MSAEDSPDGWVDTVVELVNVEEPPVEVLVAKVTSVATATVVEDDTSGTEVDEPLFDVLVVYEIAKVVADDKEDDVVVEVDEVVTASFGLGPWKAYTPSNCQCFPPKIRFHRHSVYRQPDYWCCRPQRRCNCDQNLGTISPHALASHLDIRLPAGYR